MTITARPYSFLSRPDHLPRGSLAGHVTGQLREAIVSLQLKPGTMLDKNEICLRLGVSRSPVSEALARLQSEGLIDILPQRGSVVSRVSLAAVEEYIFIRKALEGETVRLLALNTPPGLVDALEGNLEGQRASAAREDRNGFHLLDLQFHELLLNAVRYRRMKSIVDTARNNLDRARQLTNSIRRIAVGIEEHAVIVKAIRTGAGDIAARNMRSHLDGMVEAVFELARQKPEMFDDSDGTRRNPIKR